MKKWTDYVESLNVFLGQFAGLCLVASCILIIAEIANRSFFNGTFYIADEYTGYLMGVSSFLGLAYTEKHNGHIRMEFVDYLGRRCPGVVKIIKVLCYLLAIVFSLYLLMVTWKLFYGSLATGQRSYQVSETLLAIPQAFLPLGSLALFLQYTVNLVKTLRKEEVRA